MTKLKLAVLIALALLATACETFEGRTDVGLGPVYTWESAGLGGSAACEGAELVGDPPAIDSCWFTRPVTGSSGTPADGQAHFVVAGASAEQVIHEDMQLTPVPLPDPPLPASPQDVTVSAVIEGLTRTGPMSWSAAVLGARINASGPAGARTYDGYVVELVRANVPMVESDEPPCATDEWPLEPLESDYSILILYKAKKEARYCESVLRSAEVVGVIDGGTLSITAEGSTISASFTPVGGTTIQVCAEDGEHVAGSAALYGFIGTRGEGSGGSVSVDDFRVWTDQSAEPDPGEASLATGC